MDEFYRISRLPPYTFNIVRDLLIEERRKGEDIIDLGMGNPDMPTPQPIVDKLIEAVRNPRNHRYSVTRGIPKLRKAISDWYGRRFGVSIDPESEAIVTMGAKEGIGHLVLATVHTGEVVFVPDPTYPIHTYSVVIAGGDLRTIPLLPLDGFIERLFVAVKTTWPQPRMLILSFPNNPTTEVVADGFFEQIVDFAKEHKLMVVHDLAYADLTFGGYVAPSFLQVKGAKDIGVEFFSLSKSYSMPGWRVGFAVGNQKMIAALARLKSYFDYGVFQPIQIASIIALNDADASVASDRRGVPEKKGRPLPGALTVRVARARAEGDHVRLGADPRRLARHGVPWSFRSCCCRKQKLPSSPGIGFGEYGEGYVRFALIENEHRIKQAVKGIRSALAKRKR